MATGPDGPSKLVRAACTDAELSEELRFHLERDIEGNIEAGMTPGEARRAAHITVGNISAVREISRAERSGALLHQAARDLRLGSVWRGRRPAQPAVHLLARSAAERWLNMAIMVAFAAASLLLAGAGLYAVIVPGVVDGEA